MPILSSTVHFNLSENQLGCIHEILWFLLYLTVGSRAVVAAFLKPGLISIFFAKQ